MRVLRKNELHKIELSVNGESVSAMAESRTLLSDFLRDGLGFTGTHVGCEHGVCGACTVQIDGVLARSCLMLAVQLEGRDIKTIEGISNNDESLSDIQLAFRRHHALQCGFCTPGILMSTLQFLESESSPSEERVREVLSGHLCRCTGYNEIVKAVLDVVKERNGHSHA